MRVFIVAADPLARAGLAALLTTQSGLTVVGQTAPDVNLMAQVAAYHPDVVLWDLGWNAEVLIETLADFVEAGPPVLALVPDEEIARSAWLAGAKGLLLRSESVERLAAALTAVAQGLLVIVPMLRTAILRPVDPSAVSALIEPLTPRELEVLRGLTEGLSNKQIARQLAISEHTVKFHVNALMGKLGAQSRTEAVVRATRAGLILL